MPWRTLLTVWLLILPAAMPVMSAQDVKPMPGRLASCPDSPNCVSSDATDTSHHVPHFVIILPVNEAWRLVRETVKDMPRTKIVEMTDNYLRAECTSMVFRFVDDLEIELRTEGVIAVRSASRTGYRDFGVNRRRVGSLREMLRELGVIK